LIQKCAIRIFMENINGQRPIDCPKEPRKKRFEKNKKRSSQEKGRLNPEKIDSGRKKRFFFLDIAEVLAAERRRSKSFDRGAK